MLEALLAVSESTSQSPLSVSALTDGDRITFPITAPDFDGFLYVDFFAVDGSVFHLMPSRLSELKVFKAHEVIPFGESDTVNLQVSPPFGNEIFLVLFTSRMLFEKPRPLAEDASIYVADLSKKLDQLFEEQSGDDGHFRFAYDYLVLSAKIQP